MVCFIGVIVMKKILMKYTGISLLLILLLNIVGCGNNADKKYGLNPKNPVTIRLWHYYNGPQKIKFDKLVKEFNDTVGVEKGIVVEAESQISIAGVIDNVNASVNKEVAAKPMPDIISIYTDFAYKLDKQGFLVDLNKYLTEDEINEYIDSYINEGKLDDNLLKIFPIAKSTEVMMIDKVAFDKFSQATGADINDLNTYEGIARTSKLYYEWTDSLTEEKDDGKSFFGRDAMANYMVIGSKELGKDIINVNNGKVEANIDEDIMRKLWNNFYVPYISGYYGAYGKYRSDDIKMGKNVAIICATTGATYFPKEVTVDNDETYKTEAIVMKTPNFENKEPYCVQQGAGMAVVKSDSAHEYGATVFLKWFTESDRNLDFSLDTGYLPVKKMNDTEYEKAKKTIEESSSEKPVKDALLASIDEIKEYTPYTTKGFENGEKVREILEDSLLNKSKKDLEEIKSQINNGVDREQVMSNYNTEDNFKNWFNDFNKSINDLL